ncbi:uncharacterized protein DFL_009893 [Arthrobotrys flagrans]|uniref:WSC domain-containing protein n=1 Tax=Arthrobotrys flagrans TaxID=97331 RepID=A0A436ZSX0_ARTFL|nr:hypothetical protein DFL_009893 [Arthrobotrys flagrans]
MRSAVQLAATVFAFASAVVAVPQGYSAPQGFTLSKRTQAYDGKAYGCWCNDVCKSPFRDFKHIGCYDKSSDPKAWLLEWKSPYLKANQVTKQSCFAHCKGMGTRYAAIGGGGKECWCGNDLQGNPCQADKCDSTCGGDNSGAPGQNCGGQYTFSVYKDTTYTTDIDDIDVGSAAEGYVTQGCYKDDSERVVRFHKENSDNMNLSRCKTRCATLGYAWMMVENGNACFCGGALRDNAMIADKVGACNMPCTGENGENCGGGWAGFVYFNEDLESKEPCGAPMTPEEPEKPVESTTTKPPNTTTTTTKNTKTTEPPKTTSPPEEPEEPEEPQSTTKKTTTQKTIGETTLVRETTTTTKPPTPTNPPEEPEEPEEPQSTTKKTTTQKTIGETTLVRETTTTTKPPTPTNPPEEPEEPEQPGDEEPPTICILPQVPSSDSEKYKGITYPLGGIKAPSVSCHNDEAKFKAGFHFKLFAKPGAECRIDYKRTTKEIQAACWNACIEQSKVCKTTYASKKVCKDKVCWETSVLATQCETQLKACKDANTEKAEVIVKADKEWCKKYGDKPNVGGDDEGYFRRFL